MKGDYFNIFPENRIELLFGLAPHLLNQVIFQVLPVLEQKREQRLRDSPQRKRRFVKGDGRPPGLMPIHKLLMTLLYLRHNTSATAVGKIFGFSADSVEKNALPEVLSVLKELFPDKSWEAIKRYRYDKWMPEEIDQIIINSFKVMIPLLSDHDRPQ